MMDAVVAASLLWAFFFGLYALLGMIVTVAPGIVLQTNELQQQSRRWLRRLPVIAVGLWALLFVINLVYPVNVCTLCEEGARFPWSAGR